MKPPHPLEAIAELLLAEDPKLLAERSLAMLGKILDVARSALFVREQEHMQLYASRSVDQPVLELVASVWASQRPALEEGEPFAVSAGSAPPELESVLRALGSSGALAVIPCRARGSLLGLLYLDSVKPFGAAELAPAEQVAALAAVAFRMSTPPSQAFRARGTSVESYLERMPSDQIQRDQLLLHLTRNEWNIARVARILGVTRRTIYLRLERLGIRREKLVKGGARNHEAT